MMKGRTYSDLDSFAVIEQGQDAPLLREIGERIFAWLARVYETTKLMQPDADIFPSKMADTIENLLTAEHYAKLPNWLRMVQGANFVYGSREFFDAFKKATVKLDAVGTAKRQKRAVAEMEYAILAFAEPLSGKAQDIDIKDSIYRSLSLILNALATYHGLYPGAHGAVELANALQAKGVMSAQVCAVVRETWRSYEKLRNSVHVNAGREQYKIGWQQPGTGRSYTVTPAEQPLLRDAVRHIKILRRIARSFIADYHGDQRTGYYHKDNFCSRQPESDFKADDDQLTRNLETNARKRTESMSRSLVRVRGQLGDIV
jgi:hypothetical protein